MSLEMFCIFTSYLNHMQRSFVFFKDYFLFCLEFTRVIFLYSSGKCPETSMVKRKLNSKKLKICQTMIKYIQCNTLNKTYSCTCRLNI